MLRAAYVDMDGTLLGRRASLFHDGDGAFTMLGARALEACSRAEVEVVPYSGRRQETLLHNAVLLGLRSWIFEAGCGMVLDGEVQLLTEEVDEAAESAANALLLSRFPIEMYDPWNRGRESSRLYLGFGVDVAEADELLIEGGFGGWRLVDNGVMHGGPDGGRAYHLVPRDASKARAVARHMQARGYAPEEVIAVGDSMEDLGSAATVGTFWLVANAEPAVHDAARALANVRVAEGANGAGVYEAIITELAERRAAL